jgi:hypothetical protein
VLVPVGCLPWVYVYGYMLAGSPPLLTWLYRFWPLLLALLPGLLLERRFPKHPEASETVIHLALIACASAWAFTLWPGYLLPLFACAIGTGAWGTGLLLYMISLPEAFYGMWMVTAAPLFVLSSWPVGDPGALMHFDPATIGLAPAWRVAAVVVVALAVRGLIVFCARLRRMRAEPEAASVSVVIPTRCEGGRIGPLVRRVRSMAGVAEVLVVDAASGDGTAREARLAGATVLPYDPSAGEGRGGQIRTGLQAATGDVVAVLHADTNPAAGLFRRMLSALRAHPDAVGGACGMLFRGGERSLRLRGVEVANDARAAFFRISFGDQIQFARTRLARERDLWPAQPLMEDVEFSLRARRAGRVLFLRSRSENEPRTADLGTLRRARLVLGLHVRYLLPRLLGRQPDTAALYRQYYGREAHRPNG